MDISPEEALRRIRRTAEMSANIMRDTKRTGRWEGAEKVARQFDRIAELAGQAQPPSDGEIYAAASRRDQTDAEIDEMFAAIERKLAETQMDSEEPPAHCKARNLRPYDPRDCMAPNCPCAPRS